MKSLGNLSVICFLTLSCIGCTLTPPVIIKLKSSENLNPDSEMHSLPVIVQIYQLTDLDKFEQASFNDLWKKDSEILGGSLLSRKEFTILPNSETQIKLLKDSKTKYIAFLALFRNPENNDWRSSKKISVGISPRTINIFLRSNILEVK